MFNRRKMIGKLLIFSLLPMSGLLSGTPEEDIAFFQRSYLRRGNYRDLPLPGEKIGILKLFAARGEYEPVQFLMRSGKPVGNISVELEKDLQGQGTFIARKNVAIQMVVDQKLWIDPRHFERIPYLLVKEKKFSLVPEETKRIWITVHVPESAAPGRYETVVNVTSNGKLLKAIPLELTVWPFELAKITPDKMAYFTYFGPGMLPDWGRKNEYLTQIYKDMREHGMNSVTAYVFPSLDPDTDVLNSKLSPEKRKDSCLSIREFLNILDGSGMIFKGGKFIWLGAYNASAHVLKEVNAAVDKTGMEICYYGQDEPETASRQAFQRQISNRLKPLCPERKIVTAIGDKGIEAVGDCLDVWICEAIDLNDERCREAERKKKELWSYECRLASVDPLTSRFFFGFFAWRTGVKGIGLWVYGDAAARNRFGISEKMDRFHPECQYMFNFVCCESDRLLPSLAWEAVREGVDDYRYIATLEEWIGKAKKAGKEKLVRNADNFLKKMYGKIDPRNYRKAFDAARHNREPGKGGSVGANYERPSPEPSLAPEEYNRIRIQIAEEIVKLSRALETDGELP